MPTLMKDRTIEHSFLNALEDDALGTVIEFYAGRLAQHDKAIAFLADEFQLDSEQAAAMQIGVSERTLGKHLPTTDSQRGRDLRSLLKETGLYKASGHETLRGCVTFPLFAEDGRTITGIYGRRIDRHGKGAQEITVGTGEPAAIAASICVDGHPMSERATKNTKNTKAETGSAEPDEGLVVETDQVTFTVEDRRYRIRGLEKNTNVCALKVNIMAGRDELVHLDTLDLVKARSRASFIKATAAELFVEAEIIKRDIGRLLLQLETLRQQQIDAAKTPQRKPVELTQPQTDAALALLRDPNLLQRIVADIDACGMVGESTNKLAGYLAATSRKLKTPLAIVIQSSSSAGKTSLMDAILDMMPPEETIRFSGMTGQSLFYLDSDQIRHNILAISEDEGIREATYALKLLQSEGELRQATVSRGQNGRMETTSYHVQGPVQIMLTSTAMDIDEELVNRCLVLTVDETKLQTGAILDKQRTSFTSQLADATLRADALRSLHRNAQRLLRPLRVVNPYATQLTFPNHKTRMRRDHLKYLTLINTIALLHQHQRQIHQDEDGGGEFINVERTDIETANQLAGEILGRSLDELAPQTRRLLGLIHDFVSAESKAQSVSRHAFRFTRRDIRDATQWSDFQVHKHLTRLVEMEYLLAHRGQRGSRYVYELLYDGEGQNNQPFLIGLADSAQLTEPARY